MLRSPSPLTVFRPLLSSRPFRLTSYRIPKAYYSTATPRVPTWFIRYPSPLHQPIHQQTTKTQIHTKMSSATTFYDFEPVDKTGQPYPLTNLKGKVILVVNTASKCGFTPQFSALEQLHQSITSKHPDAFTVLGFPCNQFGGQDPGSNDEIQSFCQVNYGVTFPVLGKLDVNGEQTAPVYNWMKEQMSGLLGLKRIKWNFEKFLISADGKVVGRWASTTKPESLEETILKEIEKAKKEGAAGGGGEQAKLS